MLTDDALIDQRAWLDRQFAVATAHVRGTRSWRLVFGWHDRTIGARVHTPDGPRWLRVASEHERWCGGAGWTGNSDANEMAFASVPKPAPCRAP